MKGTEELKSKEGASNELSETDRQLRDMATAVEAQGAPKSKEKPIDEVGRIREQRESCKIKIFELEEAQREDGKDRRLEIAVEEKRLEQISEQLEKLL